MTVRNATPILIAAALIYALIMGVRQAQALFINPMSISTGLGIAAISLAFAVAQLVWGLSQPIAGMLADRYGAGRVLVGGTLLLALGTLLTPYADSPLTLILTLGVLAAAGAGAAGPSVIMGSTIRLTSLRLRGIATGIVNAGGSFGQFAIVPLAQVMLNGFGWVLALQWLALLSLVALPAAYLLRGRSTAPAATASAAMAPPAGPEMTLSQTLRTATGDRSFLCLSAGFFVCGFHIAFIATHLPGVVVSCSLSPNVAGWALSIIGLTNIVGSFAMGWAVGHWRMKSLLSLTYASRAVAIVLFMLAPKTELTFYLFAAALGVTYLSTVPPTAGLVAKFYGQRYVATLFGVVMLSHQVGGFLGAWLGGVAFAATGSYDWMWYADITLAVAAALVHLPIRELPMVRVAAA